MILMLMYQEIMQICILKLKRYLNTLWNWLDILVVHVTLILLILDLLYCVHITGIHIPSLKAMHSVSLFLIWLKMLFFGRGNDKFAFLDRNG